MCFHPMMLLFHYNDGFYLTVMYFFYKLLFGPSDILYITIHWPFHVFVSAIHFYRLSLIQTGSKQFQQMFHIYRLLVKCHFRHS